MDQVPEKLPRYDSRNLVFRKSYIRERLADIKRDREMLGTERDTIAAALDRESASTPPAPPYASENLRFRKAYIRDRMEALKAEREALVTERGQIDDELAQTKRPIGGAHQANGTHTALH